MLVLTRHVEEQIVIPDYNITIKVLGIHAGVVRLGFIAPREVTILRQEVADRKATQDRLITEV